MAARKTPSQIVTAFVTASQQMELDESKRNFDKLTLELKKRRKDIMEKHGVKDVVQKEEMDASKAEKFKTMDEHKVDLPVLVERLETDLKNGLTSAKATEKLTTIGRNVLSERKKTPWYVKLIHEYTSFFAQLLWAGGILCIIAYLLDESDPSNLYLGIVLFIVVLLTGLITFFQNAKSEAIMEAFKNFIPPETTVIRDGVQMKLQAELLVPGDIVIVELGKRIPADLRIIESHEMKVDNSSLTGESLMLMRSSECTNKDNPLETKNLAFFGTLCKEGSGKGIVIMTADRTVIGQIANLAASAGSEITPLRKEINRFILIIAAVAMTTGIIFFCLGFAIGYGVINNLIFAIGIIVANVPEGLLATVTVALSLTAKKLARNKVLVKNLEGVETLGSTSCICSDKTGTLTMNKMTVEHLWYNNAKVKGQNRQKMGDKHHYQYDIKEIGFQTLHECAVICSEAKFDSSLPQETENKIRNNEAFTQAQKDQKILEATKVWEKNLNSVPWLERPTFGDASESALIKFFQPITDIFYTRSQRKVLQDEEGKFTRMPFNSTNKYAFLIVEYETEDSHYCLFTKGAPEKIWTLSDRIYDKGKIVNKDEKWEKSFEDVNASFGKEGERVLGFSKLHLPKSQFPKGFKFNIYDMNFPFLTQCFIGLISVIDPPKDNVPYAVLKCKAAGIQVIMVTGDQPVTAAAIARQCNIINEKTANEIEAETGCTFEEACKLSNAVVIHGDRLTKLAIEEDGLPESEKGRQLSEWLQKPQVVFARTSPAQKLIIVAGCQRLGHTVAVTGDGVNDSPAIKKADIGIAMGIAGSDVAKDAADMILLNDDFSSIVIGIEEGRKIFDNLKKTIAYILASNIPEVFPFVAFIVCQFPLPLSTVLILCVDLGTDITPSTSYVFEDSELDIMTRLPRSREEHLVSGKLMAFAYLQAGWFETFGGFLQWCIVMNDFGAPVSQLFFLNGKKGVAPALHDTYDPQSPWLGNSNLKKLYMDNDNKCFSHEDSSEFEAVDWIYRKHDKVDLRMMVVKCGDDGRWQENVDWGECHVNQVSPVTQRPVCYSTEMAKYGHTAFFFSIVFQQMMNFFACKTQKLSLLYQGMRNPFMYFGYTTEVILIICLAYILPINIAFGTRDVIFVHFGVCALPFGCLLILWAELRRFFVICHQLTIQQIRNHKQTVKGIPNWWERCAGF